MNSLLDEFEYNDFDRRHRPQRGDLKGKRYGLLIVQSFSHVKNSAAYWLCLCDCGKTSVVRSYRLTSGSTISCGCLRGHRRPDGIKINEKAKATRDRGHAKVREASWRRMFEKLIAKGSPANLQWAVEAIRKESEG